MRHLTLSSLVILLLGSSAGIAQQASSDKLAFPPKITATIIHPPLHFQAMTECMFPLPILYFDGPGSTAIPQAYQTFVFPSQRNTYTDTSGVCFSNILQKYYQLLNIVGYRMQTFPETSLELEGGYSAETGESPQTAVTRAETVREYLSNIWGIGSDRITLRTPKQFCTSSDPEYLQEEARAVRFHTQNPELFSRVCYRRISRGTTYRPFVIDMQIDPWERRENIDSVVIFVLAGDSVLSRSVLGRPEEEYTWIDSNRIPERSSREIPIYRLHGLWYLSNQIVASFGHDNDSHIEIRTTVHLKDGEIRTGNTVREPIQIQHEPESPHSATRIALPGFAENDTVLSSFQEQWIDEILQESTAIEITGYSIETEYTPASQLEMYGHRRNYPQTRYTKIQSLTLLDNISSPDTYRHAESLWDDAFLAIDYGSEGDKVLSNDRAKAVQSWLRQQGYSGLAVEVKRGKISADPDEFDLPEKRAYNRCTELNIQPPLER